MLTNMSDYRKEQRSKREREKLQNKMTRIIPNASDMTINEYGVIQPTIREFISDWLKKMFNTMQSTRDTTKKN